MFKKRLSIIFIILLIFSLSEAYVITIYNINNFTITKTFNVKKENKKDKIILKNNIYSRIKKTLFFFEYNFIEFKIRYNISLMRFLE